MDRLALERGLPRVLRSSTTERNSAGAPCLTWAHLARRHVALDRRLGKPNQDAYIESFNELGSATSASTSTGSRSLAHTQILIETWRREYNEEPAEAGTRRAHARPVRQAAGR